MVPGSGAPTHPDAKEDRGSHFSIAVCQHSVAKQLTGQRKGRAVQGVGPGLGAGDWALTLEGRAGEVLLTTPHPHRHIVRHSSRELVTLFPPHSDGRLPIPSLSLSLSPFASESDCGGVKASELRLSSDGPEVGGGAAAGGGAGGVRGTRSSQGPVRRRGFAGHSPRRAFRGTVRGRGAMGGSPVVQRDWVGGDLLRGVQVDHWDHAGGPRPLQPPVRLEGTPESL